MRSFIQNLLLILALAGAGLAVTLWVQVERQKEQIRTLKQSEELLLESTKIQGESITELRNLRELDSIQVGTLNDRIESLAQRDSRLREKLRELELQDEDISAYLNSDVPSSVSCLFDGSCDSNPDGSTYPPEGSPKALLLAPEPKAD